MMDQILEMAQKMLPEMNHQTDPPECEWLLQTLQELSGFLKAGDSLAFWEGIHTMLSPVSGNGYLTNQMPIHPEGWVNIDSGIEHDCLFAAVVQGLLLSQGANPLPLDLPDQARNLRLRMLQHWEDSALMHTSENLFEGHLEKPSHLVESSGDNAQWHPDITSPPPAGLPEIQMLVAMLDLHICVHRLTQLGTMAKFIDANKGKQISIQILYHKAHFTLIRPSVRQDAQQVLTLEDNLEMILSSLPWKAFRMAAEVNQNWATTARHMLDTRDV